jgi:hypothetical protein
VFTAVSVMWFSLGMGLIIAPAWTVEIFERLMSDEFRLFVLSHLEMIVSLVLIVAVGTSGFPLRLRVFWIVVCCLGLLKGLFLIWAPITRREAFLDWSLKRPFWEYRVCGLILVVLATGLAYGINQL